MLCLAFPTSFYTGLVYSEALFLLLSAMFFWALFAGKNRWAGIAGFLLPLTRPQGVLAAVPALWRLVEEGRAKRPGGVRMALLCAGALAAGFAAYLVIMKISAGDYLAGFASQNYFVARNTLSNLAHPFRWFLENFVQVRLVPHGFTNSMLDRGFFLLFLVSLIPVYRRLDRTLFVYSLVLGLMAALAGSFMAYTRYLLPVFPIYMAWAMSLRRKYVFLLIPAAFLQVLFLVAHCLNYWVA